MCLEYCVQYDIIVYVIVMWLGPGYEKHICMGFWELSAAATSGGTCCWEELGEGSVSQTVTDPLQMLHSILGSGALFTADLC